MPWNSNVPTVIKHRSTCLMREGWLRLWRSVTGVRAPLRAVTVALIGLATPSIFPHNGGPASLGWPAEHSPLLRHRGLPGTFDCSLHSISMSDKCRYVGPTCHSDKKGMRPVCVQTKVQPRCLRLMKKLLTAQAPRKCEIIAVNT